MKSTGIVRRIDEMGRIVLPAELRRTMDIGERETMEIFTDGPSIVLKKYTPACIFCDSGRSVSLFKVSRRSRRFSKIFCNFAQKRLAIFIQVC